MIGHLRKNGWRFLEPHGWVCKWCGIKITNQFNLPAGYKAFLGLIEQGVAESDEKMAKRLGVTARTVKKYREKLNG